MLIGLLGAPRQAAAKGLDGESGRAAIGFFMQEIAAEAPNFSNALPALKSAGYHFNEQLVFFDPSGWIQVSFPEAQMVMMACVVEKWGDQQRVFEEKARAAFGESTTEVLRASNVVSWESRINGSTVGLFMTTTDENGLRLMVLVALVRPEETS